MSGLRQNELSAQRKHSIVAVVLVDLDHFKLINELPATTGGSIAAADAHRMLACVRDTDTVVRLGGASCAVADGRGVRGNVAGHATRLNAIARALQDRG